MVTAELSATVCESLWLRCRSTTAMAWAWINPLGTIDQYTTRSMPTAYAMMLGGGSGLKTSRARARDPQAGCGS